MGLIRNIENEETVFESSDPAIILEKISNLSSDWHKKYNKPIKECAPYSVEGFDAVEMESGTPYDNRDPETGALFETNFPPPEDSDRLVINEKTNTITVYGNAEAPLDHDGEIINA